MVMQASGPIKLSDICKKFIISNSNAVSLSSLYRGLSYVSTNNSMVPTSGAIKFSDFYGAAASTPSSSNMGSTSALTTNSVTYPLSSYLADACSSGGVTLQ